MASRASFISAENKTLVGSQAPPVQPSATPSAPFSHPAGTKRKRSQDSEANADELEGVRSSKHYRGLSAHDRKPPENLQDSVAEADKPEGVSHSEEPQELPPPARLVQSSPTPPTPISQLLGTKRKRSQDSDVEAEADELEDLRPSKQPRELPEHKLSERNLRLHNRSMDDAVNSSRDGSIKRSSSQRSLSRHSNTASDGTQGTKSSASTNAHYRFKILRPALINVHADPPPKSIQDAIDAIVEAEPPEGRQEQLEPISQVFRARCAEKTRASVGENDYVKIFHDALDAMSFNNLCLRTNADWQEHLKPKIQHSRFNVGSLRSKAGCQQQQMDNVSAPPPAKRQQQIAGQTYISPEPSMANGSDSSPINGPQESHKMPPPAPIPEKQGIIKTPRPDISMGIVLRALVSALSSQDLNEVEAELFLGDLQAEKERQEPDGLEEPMLISAPAPRASDLVFPFAVLEGKAYLTGKQISEAENQAAVSGACALKMQLRLDELAKRATAKPSKDQPPTSSDGLPALLKGQLPKLRPPSENQIPLFFSICTEGPIHQLFVHWTEVNYGKRQFNMRLLKCVHGLLPTDMENFFVKVDNVLRWGTEHFLESLVVRLGKLARDSGA